MSEGGIERERAMGLLLVLLVSSRVVRWPPPPSLLGRIPSAAAMANLMSSGMGKRRESRGKGLLLYWVHDKRAVNIAFSIPCCTPPPADRDGR